MAAKQLENLNLSFTCAICLDVPPYNDVVESSCCHNLFCSSCIERLTSCPICRTNPFNIAPAHFAGRIIGSMSIKCPNNGCEMNLTHADLAAHLEMYCEFSEITCPDPKCNGYKCAKAKYFGHFQEEHLHMFYSNYQQLWHQTNNQIVGRERFKSQTEARVPPSTANNNPILDDRIETTRNKFGRQARLGRTGKFYCGGLLDGPSCSCCDGRCGPSSGCNCSGCMLLDIEKRKLPRSWFVNRDGASARCSLQHPSRFYCGRLVIPLESKVHGYCGPHKGKQCTACSTLSQQRHGRYQQVWQD